MKIGQTVYLQPYELGNAYRYDKSIRTSEIVKIGRKYVTIKGYGQFYIDTGLQKTDYTSEYKIYFDKNALELEIESEDLKNRIENSIPKYGKWNIEIEKLNKMNNIITNYEYPPIPIRDYDWSAIREDYEPGDFIGTGRTEKDAIADLVRQENEY